MAGELPPIVVSIEADVAKLKSQMAEAERTLSGFGAKAKTSSGGVDALAGSFKRFLGAAALVAAAKQGLDFLGNSAKAYQEDAMGAGILANQLQNVAGATTTQIAAVEKAIGAMELMSGVADDALRPAMGSLVRATGDTAKATKLLDTALNISAATGKDVGTVSAALGKAYLGNTGALAKMVPGVKNASDKMAYLEKTFAGAAEKAADLNPYSKIQRAFDHIQEAVGRGLMPVLNTFADFMVSLVGPIESFFAAVNDPTTETGKNWAQLITLIQNFGLAFDNMFRGVQGADVGNFFIQMTSVIIAGIMETIWWLGELGQWIFKLFSGKWDELGKDIGSSMTRYNKFVDDIQKPVAKKTPTKTGLDYAAGGGGFDFQDSSSAGNKSKIQDYIKQVGQLRKKANQAYGDDVAAANKDFADKVGKAEKAYTEAVATATKSRDESLAKELKNHTANVLKIQADFAAKLQEVVQASMNRLRSAFQSGTGFNVNDMWQAMKPKDGVLSQAIYKEVRNGVEIAVSWWGAAQNTLGQGVGGLITGLKSKLEASKKLAENAAALQGAGFSQTFIEQVVAAGTDSGNELAKSILEASPATQAELSQLYTDMETVSETGMDGLAKTIYDKTGLATRELKALYTQTNAELATALADEQKQYDEAILEINKTFDEAMLAAKKDRDDAIAEAQKDLTDALTQAAKALYDSLSDIETAFKDKIAGMKGALAGMNSQIAATNKSLAASKAAATAAGAKAATSTAGTGVVFGGGSGYGVTNSVTVNAQTNATPSAIADSAAMALKYNIPLSLLTA